MDIQDLPPLRVAAIRHVGPYEQMGPSFKKVCDWAGQRSLFGPGTKVLGVFHDDPKTMAKENLRGDAAITVAEGVGGDSGQGITITEIEGGPHAVGVLKGPYAQLAAAYDWLFSTWLPTTGRKVKDGPSYEIYLNDEATTPVEDLLTEIRVPLVAE